MKTSTNTAMKADTLKRFSFNDGPSSATLGQHERLSVTRYIDGRRG